MLFFSKKSHIIDKGTDFVNEQILERIVHAELICNKGIYDTYYLPYYRFYIEIPGGEESDGMKRYGWYDIPAIQEIYISEDDASE